MSLQLYFKNQVWEIFGVRFLYRTFFFFPLDMQ